MGWMWLTARFVPADLLFCTEHGPQQSRQEATDTVLGVLSALPDGDLLFGRVLAGPLPGKRDVTITVRGRGGLLVVALVELAGRSAQRAADDWVQTMAERMREQGVHATVHARSQP